MAYVPPHKRHNSNNTGPTPDRPPFILRKSQQTMDQYRPDIAFAEASVTKWFVVGISDQSLLSALTRLDPVPIDSFGRNSLALVLLKGDPLLIDMHCLQDSLILHLLVSFLEFMLVKCLCLRSSFV